MGLPKFDTDEFPCSMTRSFSPNSAHFAVYSLKVLLHPWLPPSPKQDCLTTGQQHCAVGPVVRCLMATSLKQGSGQEILTYGPAFA